MQLSSLTWTLVFQTQQSDSTVSTTAISKPELRNTQDFASIHTHVRESKFYDTIVETVHCGWNGALFSLSIASSLSITIYNVHACDYIYFRGERKFQTIFQNFSIFFFFLSRDFDRNKSEELRRNFVSLVIRRVVYL